RQVGYCASSAARSMASGAGTSIARARTTFFRDEDLIAASACSTAERQSIGGASVSTPSGRTFDTRLRSIALAPIHRAFGNPLHGLPFGSKENPPNQHPSLHSDGSLTYSATRQAARNSTRLGLE